jgi:RNA polymerase sigma-70 factor (ECF subfamily)
MPRESPVPEQADIHCLYERHRVVLYRAIRAVVLDGAAAEDLTQETFERAWARRRELARVANVSAWLHRVGLRLAIDHQRAQARRRRLPHLLGPVSSVPGPEAQAEVQDAAAIALRALSPRERATVSLHFVAQLRTAEIAQVLGIPDGTVKSRLAAGLGKMRRALDRSLTPGRYEVWDDHQHGPSGPCDAAPPGALRMPSPAGFHELVPEPPAASLQASPAASGGGRRGC